MITGTLIATPGPINYCTSRINIDSLIEGNEIAELGDEFNNHQFSAHGCSSRVESVGSNAFESSGTNLEPHIKRLDFLQLSSTLPPINLDHL